MFEIKWCIILIIVHETTSTETSTISGGNVLSTCPLQQPFACGNMTQICLRREQVCDRVEDCPNRRDEMYETCNDNHGWFENMKTFIANITPVPHAQHCNLTLFPDKCSCMKNTRVNCKMKEFKRIPAQSLSVNTTHLFMGQNLIEIILESDFENLTNLERLALSNNSLKIILPGTFRKLQNLTMLYLDMNYLQHLSAGVFQGLSSLKWLSAGKNKIVSIETGVFKDVPRLVWINLADNVIQTSETEPVIDGADSLIFIDMEGNAVEKITQISFQRKSKVSTLMLSRNKIKHIEQTSFQSMRGLNDLDLSHNEIKDFPETMFTGLMNISKLSIGYNQATILHERIFSNLTSLHSLNLEGMKIDNFNIKMFEKLKFLKFSYFSDFKYCQFTPQVTVCEPRSDGISSVEDLLGRDGFRVCIWMMVFMCLVGNSLVLFGRHIVQEQNQVHSLIIRNLCVADALMGIYLVIIGAKDISYRGEYNKYANEWMSSFGCQATGIVAMVSSEVSLLILAYMSIQRFMYITQPFSHVITMRGTVVGLVTIWCTGILIALIPVLPIEELRQFYGNNGVCFPLQIYDAYSSGWRYSAAIIYGLNGSVLVIITFCYTGMFISIQRTRRNATLTIKAANDMSFAKRFLIIIVTDALCWLPIICLKLYAMGGNKVSGEVHAWIAIFVLPINSSINPFLYSLSTASFRKKLTALRQRSKTMSNGKQAVSRTRHSGDATDCCHTNRADILTECDLPSNKDNHFELTNPLCV